MKQTEKEKKVKSRYGQYLDYLIDGNLWHEISYTNKTRVVNSDLGRVVFTTSDFKHSGINMIRKVKKYVMENLEDLKGLDIFGQGFNRVKLFDYNQQLEYEEGAKYGGVVEIDLNKAYWTSAFKLKVISKEIYEEGLNGLKTRKFTKIDLLACLGSLAKVKRKRTYDVEKKKYIYHDPEYSTQTSFLWDAISWEVDKCMQEIQAKLGRAFLFYWTDAVFIENKPEYVMKTFDIVSSHGFDAKEVPIQYINVDYGQRDRTGLKMYAWTISPKGGAKIPIQDDDGFYGREFPFQRRSLEEHLKSIFKEIEKEKAKKAKALLKKQNKQTHIENEKAEIDKS